MNNNTNRLYNLYVLNRSLNIKNRYDVLKIGMSNNSVIILQDKLKILNYYFLSITGNFDKNTENAVIEFQKDNNLTATGIVDNSTWELLYLQTSPPTTFSNILTPTLSLGDSSEDVKTLQEKLKILNYYYGDITGVFDTDTEIAVKQFQLNNTLTPDGIVGVNTWARINYLYEPLTECENTLANFYTVEKGDTLYSIALALGFTVERIKELNNLESDLIYIGQILKISDDSEDTTNATNYVVEKGDTLYAIANKFNTTIDEIKALNSLTSDIISIGQTLKLFSDISTYTVAKGDTLYSIAKKYDTTVDEIKKINNLTSDIISIGQTLSLGLL